MMKTNPLRRRVEMLLWWLGLGLLIAGLVMLARSTLLAAGLMGGGLALVGLNILLGGEVVAGPEPRVFTARGQVVRGHVDVRAGLSDLLVGVGSNDRVATTRYGPIGRPHFTAEDGVADLRLKGSILRPNIARWQADLAGNVLWDIDARSSLGDLVLNLVDLRIEQVSAATMFGRLAIACPARGYVQIDLRSAFGVIEVRVPPDVGARVTVERGELSTLSIKNERLLALSQRRYATHDFDSAPAQVEIHIKSTAGDVFLL